MKILLVILILLLCFVGLILYGALLCKIEEVNRKISNRSDEE